MSEETNQPQPTNAIAGIVNTEVEEVVCEWDADMPDPRSERAAEIVERAYRRDDGRNVRSKFSGTRDGEPIFTIEELPAGQTAATVRQSHREANPGFENFLRNATDNDLAVALSLIQAERTRRLSSKSKAAKREDRKKRAAARKKAKAERKAAADDWSF